MKPKEAVAAQREYFNTGATRPVSIRKLQLMKLKETILKFEEDIYTAMKEDLNKSKTETYLTEIGVVLEEITYTLKHVERWAKKERANDSLATFPSKNFILKEPYGTVCILSPWNYPFQLCISPLIGAIAAGNCVVLKVSKSTPHVSAVIKDMIEDAFKPEFVHCFDPVEDTYEEILAEKYDYIMFTGSQRVGKIIMEAASQHLTPLTLELGGKSPCIVEQTADLRMAAKRIAWGKFINAGQTCVAPDYVYVDATVKQALINYLIEAITELYGKNPLRSPDYGKIISEFHYKRLFGLMHGEKVVYGGVGDKDSMMIAPTILDGITFESKVMQEEIFGPVLPIVTYDHFDSALEVLKPLPKPLAVYLFTTNQEIEEKVLNGLVFGGGCVNDTVLHVSRQTMPFGGVGESGMGSYHGRYTFDTFTHKKSILKKSNRFDVKLRYPPYSEKTLKTIKKVLK